jgi:hypothetical protein
MDQSMFGTPPTTGQRIGRGLGWGALIAQWWTLLNTFWFLVWNFNDVSQHSAPALFVGIIVVVLAIFFAIVGSIMGLIIGAMDADEGTGAIVGVVFGVICLGIEFLLARNAGALTSIIFYYFTGRFIGAQIAAKVQAREGV